MCVSSDPTLIFDTAGNPASGNLYAPFELDGDSNAMFPSMILRLMTTALPSPPPPPPSPPMVVTVVDTAVWEHAPGAAPGTWSLDSMAWLEFDFTLGARASGTQPLDFYLKGKGGVRFA